MARPGVLEWGSRWVESRKGFPISPPSGDGSVGYAPPQNFFSSLFGSKWFILVHFAHCFFYRAMHVPRTGTARYMLGSGVCLSVCHKVKRRRFVNVDERIIT